MNPLTKSDFILYRECPHNVWVKWHMPDEYAQFEVSDFEKALAVMGNDVEILARGMFPHGYLVERRSEGAQVLTQKLIRDHTPVIFQAVFATDTYLAATDVLKWNDEAQKYDIYEIKMSTTEEADDEEVEEGKQKKVSKKKELQHEYDLAFQANVVEACGVHLNKKYLVRLNRHYKRMGDLDFTPHQLFIIEDKTKAIDTLMPIAEDEMASAYQCLRDDTMPTFEHTCYYRGRSSHCTAFSCITKIPAYSVHDLNRIGNSPKLLRSLIEEGIVHMSDVPQTYDGLVPKPTKDNPHPKPRKLNQVKVHTSEEPIIDIEAIRTELDSLKFPLYFLDYETYPTAIPPYSGYHPYQHIVFQYSLHVVRDTHSEPLHCEHIVLNGNPAEEIAKSLREHIGDEGTIVSWYKKFENSRNKEFASTLVDSDLRAFFADMVTRTYDLMDIVENQHYVHPGFEGRSSIKKVLPVIAKLMGHEAELSYKKLGVKSGTDAIEAYRQISTWELTGDKAQEKRREMLEYCKLDTYAMYEIWRFLSGLV